MEKKLFIQLTGLALAQTSTQTMLLLLSAAIWLSAPAAFAADETCASYGKEVSVSGEFAHSKHDASLTIEGADNNAAAFHEEIYGEKFTVTIARLPADKYTIVIGEAATWASAPRGHMQPDRARGYTTIVVCF